MQSVLFLLLLTFATTFANAAPVASRDLCEWLLQAQPEHVFIHDSQGLVRVHSFDPAADKVTVVSADRHRYYRYTRDHVYQNRMLNPLTLANASAQEMAPVGTPESLRIARRRALRTLGDLERPAMIFALMNLGGRLLDHPSETSRWAEKFLSPEGSTNEAAASAIAHRMRTIRGTPQALEQLPWVRALVETVYRETGEDLVLSGLLRAYAGDYPRGLRAPGFRERITFLSTWHNRPRNGIDADVLSQDVDHYMRSVAWREHVQLLDLTLEPRIHKENFAYLADTVVIASEDGLAPARRFQAGRHTSRPELIQVTRREKSRESTMPPMDTGMWNRIWEVAGTVDLPTRVVGRQVWLVTSHNEFLDAEIVRVLMDHGADSVRIGPTD